MSLSVPSSTPSPLVIAHRGGAHAAPQNTIAAFRQGWADGADGIEGDFFLSADGHVVCIHDRNTGELADRSLDVTESTLAELKTLDVGFKKGKAFVGERVPTLEEVIVTVPDQKKLFVEVKDSVRVVAPIAEVIGASNLSPEQVAVIAFDRSVVQESKRRMPDIKAYWILNQRMFTDYGVSKVLDMAREIRADGIDIEAHQDVRETSVSACRGVGLEVHCWTINDATTAKRFAQWGVDSMTTDRPALIRAAMGR